ncbi:MAG: metallophosphoesterase family protein [Planctomycetales bacterium]
MDRPPEQDVIDPLRFRVPLDPHLPRTVKTQFPFPPRIATTDTQTAGRRESPPRNNVLAAAMKILVLADIHSNWPALSAIHETFDACLFLGDLVDYATDPVPCIDWVRANSSMAIRGNHDHAVAQHVPARGGAGFRALAAATRPVHWELIDSNRLKYLARLPVSRRLTIGDLTFHLLHATPRDPLDEYLGDDPAAWQARVAEIDADFLCVGHTHRPLLLETERLRVLNPGSVGQPRDGDPRAAYAVIENGRVEFRRVEYDIDATLQQMRSVGIGEEGLRLAESALRTGGSLPDD